MNLIESQIHLVKGLDPIADAFEGTVYSDIVDVSLWKHVCFVMYIGVGATGTSILTVVPVSNIAAGASGTAVSFEYRECLTGDTWTAETTAATFTTTAGSSKMVSVELDTDAIEASGYKYCRLSCVQSVDAACLGCLFVILSEPRYAQAVAASAID